MILYFTHTKKKARDKREHNKKDARENDRRHAQRRPRPRFADTNTTKRVAALNDDDDEPRRGGEHRRRRTRRRTKRRTNLRGHLCHPYLDNGREEKRRTLCRHEIPGRPRVGTAEQLFSARESRRPRGHRTTGKLFV